MDQDQNSMGGIGFSFNVGSPPEQTLPPLRLLVVGDFVRHGQRSQGPPRAVDRETFASVLAGLGCRLKLPLPNLLGKKPDVLHLDLAIGSLQDLTPAALATQVEELRRVKRLAEGLWACARGKAAPESLQPLLADCAGFDALAPVFEAVEAALDGDRPAGGPGPRPAPAQKPASGGGDKDAALDRILGMVDVGQNGGEASPEQTQAQAAGAVNALVGGILGRSGKASVPKGPAGLRRAAEALEQALGRQVDALLHHPKLQRLEASLRGLKFLVDRTDFRKGLQLQLLDLPKEGLLEGFEQRVYQAEMAGYSDQPLTLVLLDYAFENGPADQALLQGLAELGEGLQVPLLAGIGLDFFELEPGPAPQTRAYLGNLLEEPQYVKWNALRDKACARWLGVCFNRVLLRLPYRAGRRGALAVDEGTPEARDFLWGSAVWAVGALVAGSFQRVGWPTEITGNDDGALEDLPMRELSDRAGRTLQLSVEAFLPDELCADLARAGIITLCAPLQGDRAVVFRAPMLHRPAYSQNEAKARAARRMSTLPYQLLASRVADLLGRNKARLTGGASPQAAGQALQAFLQGIVAGTGPGAASKVELRQGDDGTLLADLELRTGRNVMGGTTLAFTIPL